VQKGSLERGGTGHNKRLTLRVLPVKCEGGGVREWRDIHSISKLKRRDVSFRHKLIRGVK
jgi:hypothetical protein